MFKLFKILFLSQNEGKKIPTNAVYHKQNAVGIRPQKRLKNEITRRVYNND